MIALLGVLDVLAAAASLLLAAFFGRTWWRTRDDLHLLLATGFVLLAVSYPAVAVSHADPLGPWNAARLAGQTPGAAGLALAYASRRGPGRVARVAGWGVAIVGLASLALALLLSPRAQEAARTPALVAAHAIQAACLAACAAYAWRPGGRTMALVPLGFASLAASKLAWLAVDLGAPDALVALVYACRFAGLGLLLAVAGVPLRLPRPLPRREPA